jgi:hypothetical protein
MALPDELAHEHWLVKLPRGTSDEDRSVLIGEMLFVRRFGLAPSQQTLVAAIRSVVTDPARETLEFIKRDVLNLALRNTNNHAQNTAVQRTADGHIQLTPDFDFAPMFKDDFVLLADSAQALMTQRKAIDVFLRDHLALDVHPYKTVMQRCTQGLDFWMPLFTRTTN